MNASSGISIPWTNPKGPATRCDEVYLVTSINALCSLLSCSLNSKLRNPCPVSC